MSVTIIGPGDAPPVHDRDAEIAKEFAGEAVDSSAMVLLPPSIEQVE